jgi:hypothetical protein
MSQALIRTLNHKLALYLGINTMELYVDIHIWVTKASLETADPLYQQKRIIVQRNNRLTVQTFQIYKGKEKEAVLEMLPYLRLGNLSDPNEMESVNFAQGPVCPVSFHPLKTVYSGLMKEADMQSSKNNFSNA